MSEMSEMDKLERYLKEKGIKYKRFTTSAILGTVGEQIIAYENGRRKWDAVCGYGTYGRKCGLLEVMGKPVVKDGDKDSVAGFLTAQDVINRLEDENL